MTDAVVSDPPVTLAEKRLLIGLNQKQVAKRLEVSQNTVCGWEQGRQKPEPSRFKKVCLVYEMEGREWLQAWHYSKAVHERNGVKDDDARFSGRRDIANHSPHDRRR